MRSMYSVRLALAGLVSALTIIAFSAPVVPSLAQSPTQPATEGAPMMPPLPGTAVGGPLQSPRGISFDANGNLLVAVAGNGGETNLNGPNPENPPQMSQIKAGLSGEVLSIDKTGKATPLISGLPSYNTPGEVDGIYRAVMHGDSLWLVFSSTGPGAYWGDSVVELDAKSLKPKHIISLSFYEATNNPDGAEISSNASAIAWEPDGTLLITDAGGNTLYSWTEKAGLAVVNTWKDDSVPDSLQVAPNGDIYIGFLGKAFAGGAARIEHWSGGKLVETFDKLDTVTDILLDGNTLYAVELVVGGAAAAGLGRVVTVDVKGVTPVAEGLITPFGIAKGPDGALYVSYGTIASFPGVVGGIVKLNSK